MRRLLWKRAKPSEILSARPKAEKTKFEETRSACEVCTGPSLQQPKLALKNSKFLNSTNITSWKRWVWFERIFKYFVLRRFFVRLKLIVGLSPFELHSFHSDPRLYWFFSHFIIFQLIVGVWKVYLLELQVPSKAVWIPGKPSKLFLPI